MVNCRVCEEKGGSSEDDAVNTENGCDCGWIHRDCSVYCDGCHSYFCDDHWNGVEINGRDYCEYCFQGMIEELNEHFATGREHGDW